MVLKAHQSRINTTDIRSARLPIIEKGGETWEAKLNQFQIYLWFFFYFRCRTSSGERKENVIDKDDEENEKFVGKTRLFDSNSIFILLAFPQLIHTHHTLSTLQVLLVRESRETLDVAVHVGSFRCEYMLDKLPSSDIVHLKRLFYFVIKQNEKQ
jgi:hypothetical protein